MEQITRLNTNLRLLKMHQKTGHAAGNRTVSVELSGLRVGDFVLTTFPGELTVPVGLNIKRAAKHPHAFVAGYTNGYVHYAPTAEQLKNIGGHRKTATACSRPNGSVSTRRARCRWFADCYDRKALGPTPSCRIPPNPCGERGLRAARWRGRC